MNKYGRIGEGELSRADDAIIAQNACPLAIGTVYNATEKAVPCITQGVQLDGPGGPTGLSRESNWIVWGDHVWEGTTCIMSSSGRDK